MGACTCASGNQVCTGHIGIFTAKLAKKASHSQVCADLGKSICISVGTSDVPVTDTIKTADPTDGRVLSTPDRSTLFAVQTPQVMEASLLKAALQSAIDAGVELTDDCSAVERLGKEVYLATGSRENIKITTPLDLLIAEAILRGRDQ